MHDASDALGICVLQSAGYDWTHTCHFCFGLVGTDIMVTFKMSCGDSSAVSYISSCDL